MSNSELENEFDVLYNSITSNQAPGLNVYEKSVFLTKAQDEVVKSYFNPRSNKTQEGFDGNEKRQIDFSMIMRSKVYQIITVSPEIPDTPDTSDPSVPSSQEDPAEPIPSQSPLVSSTIIKSPVKLKRPIEESDGLQIISFDKGQMIVSSLDTYLDLVDTNHTTVDKFTTDDSTQYATLSPFKDSFFDMRDNTKSVVLEDDIMMFINEYVEAIRNGSPARLTVIPINYIDYSRLMSKPYKRPLRNQAWRLLDNSDGYKKAELVIGPNDIINKYVIRYVKRPRAIILAPLDGVTLDGYVGAKADGTPTKITSEATQGIECELDPILHPEILQRAVELAKASYQPDASLNSMLTLGNSSQTQIGYIPTSK